MNDLLPQVQLYDKVQASAQDHYCFFQVVTSGKSDYIQLKLESSSKCHSCETEKLS